MADCCKKPNSSRVKSCRDTETPLSSAGLRLFDARISLPTARHFSGHPQHHAQRVPPVHSQIDLKQIINTSQRRHRTNHAHQRLVPTFLLFRSAMSASSSAAGILALLDEPDVKLQVCSFHQGFPRESHASLLDGDGWTDPRQWGCGRCPRTWHLAAGPATESALCCSHVFHWNCFFA